MEYTRVEATQVTKPRALTPEQREYDQAIKDLMNGDGHALVVPVAPEANEQSMRTKFTYAAKRAGVEVESWYDPERTAVVVQRKKAK